MIVTGNYFGRRGRPPTHDIEARLLSVLASRPNIVCPKSDLAATVCRDANTEPHAIEVAIGRLRRRLAPSGLTIASVHRRGYVLRP